MQSTLRILQRQDRDRCRRLDGRYSGQGRALYLEEAGDRQLTIQIGRMPLRLSAAESNLITRAATRYTPFASSRRTGFPVLLDSAAGPPFSDSAFRYQLNGSSIEVAEHQAHLRSMANEYELDSLLRVLLSVVLLRRRGFLLHAASVVRDGRGYVFMGRSGAGKSTVAGLSPAGSVLTDEISLLRCTAGKWRAYGTPFWGEFRAEGQDRSAPLAGIFLLVQAGQDRKTLLGSKQALAALLSNVLFFERGRAARDGLLGMLLEMTHAVPVCRLEFQKHDSFWDVIR